MAVALGSTLAAEVGVGFAKDLANSLLGQVTTMIQNELVLLWGFKDDLKSFRKKLEMVQAMLSGEVGDPNTNPLLVIWLNKVKELMLVAEDVLDDYAYEMMRRKIHRQQQCVRQQKGLRLFRLKTNFQLFFSRSSNPVLFRLKMAHKVKSLKDGLADIFNEAKDLGIKPVKVAAGADAADRRRYEEKQLAFRRENVDCEGIIGRDKDKENIISLICDGERRSHHLFVIGIYGMAGLGKTTICRDIFNTLKLKGIFNDHIWITVSHDFETEQLLRQMADQVAGKDASNSISTEVVKNKMKERLNGKKYLLVLDDIWDTFENEWEPFRNLLQEMRGAEGTTILAISRSEDVLAKLQTHKSDGMGGIGNPYIYRLGKLIDEECWKLFRQRVDDDEGLKDPLKKSVVECLLNKCDGVPLAIRTLGDLLRRRKETNEWVTIRDSEIWDENDNEIMPSVKLSFKYLSSTTLKRCFALCGIFREDEIIDKDGLIQLWIGNGLLQSYDDGGDKMERVGEQYFNELLNNSLFQDANVYRFYAVTYKMHDVVHKLARDILKQESSLSSETQHHLFETIDINEVQAEQVSNDKLRTLRLLGMCERLDEKVRLSDFKCLRALSLVGMGLKELPDSIGMLKHLRYLDVSHNYDLKSVPEGVAKLHHLQTLRMVGIGKIQRFPREISKLVNLRHFCNDRAGMGVPQGLGMLNRLQTLPMIDLKVDWGGKLNELKSLNHLRGRIVLRNLQVANKEEIREVKLESKKNIEDLALYWADNYDGENNSSREEDKKVLDVLQPHPNLRGLRIDGYKAKTLSEWVLGMKGSISYLTRLQIIDCDYITCLPDVRALTRLEYLDFIDCKNVNRIEELSPIFDHPKLQELELGPFSGELDTIFPPLESPLTTPLSKSLVQLCLYGDGMEKVKNVPPQIQYLLALQSLYIRGFQSVEEIPEWLSNLTSLQELLISNLPKLKRLPPAEAMQQLTELTTLYIQLCPIMNEECAEGSGPQWPNIQHIPNIGISRSVTP